MHAIKDRSNCLACIGKLPFVRLAIMKALLLFSLVSIVPALSYSSRSVRSGKLPIDYHFLR